MSLTPLLLVAALHAQPTPVLVQAQNTTTQTSEGLEILRRILVDSLEKTFQSEKKEQRISSSDGDARTRGLVTLLWAGGQTIEHSRVFHLPEAGVFFALDAALPMVEKQGEPAREPGGDAPRDDEWEKYRREVRDGAPAVTGKLYHLGDAEVREMEIDPTAVDKLIDSALQTLARHASRIEGLGAQETITLAVKLSGSYGGHFWGSFMDEGELRAVAPEGQPEEGFVALPRMSTIVARSGSSSQNLVLQVRVSDLSSLASGGTLELRRRARINRY